MKTYLNDITISYTITVNRKGIEIFKELRDKNDIENKNFLQGMTKKQLLDYISINGYNIKEFEKYTKEKLIFHLLNKVKNHFFIEENFN